MLLVKRYTVYIFQHSNVANCSNSALHSLTIKMTHTEHQKSHSMTSQSRLLYGLHDQPPFKDALVIGSQHICAIFIPVCTSGLLITAALGLDPATSYILGMSLFVSGLGTFIQVNRLEPIGSGLLAVQGTSFAFVTAILAVVATSIAKALKLFTFYSISIHSFCNCFVGWAVYGSA